MSSESIAAKRFLPRVVNVVPRPRLFEKLDGILADSTVVWVSAPAGSGKTSLVAGYLQERGLSSLWYRIEDENPDYKRFQEPDGTKMGGEAAVATQVGLGWVIRTLQPGTILVFDNLAFAPDSTPVDWLRKAPYELPQGSKLIVISRDSPPAALARPRINGALFVLEGAELRLTVEEAHALADLRAAEGRQPPADTIRAMWEWVDGWPAGFAVLFNGLGAGDLSSQPPPWPDERLLFDYLAVEVFGALAHHERDFLRCVSILPVVTPEIAAAVCEVPDTVAMLESVSRRLGIFVREIPPGGRSYTFSPIFRAFLAERQREATTSGERGALARNAADALSNAGRVDDAVHVLATHGEWAALGALVSREARGRFAKGDGASVLSWLKPVPPGVLEKDADLCYCMGAAKTPLDFAESLRWFERAYTLYSEQGERFGALNAWSAIVETIFFQWGDFSKLRSWIHVGEKLLAGGSDIPDGPVGRRAVGAMFNALMNGQPDHPKIGAWAQRMRRILREIDDDSERLLMGTGLFIYYTKWLGEHGQAEIVLEMLCPPPERKPQLTPMARILLAMAQCTYHWNRYELAAADSAIQDGFATAERCGIRIWDFLLHAQPIYAGLSSGDLPKADRYLSRMRELLPRRAPLDHAHYHYLAGWEAMLREDSHRALEHVQYALELVTEARGPMQHALTCLAMAQVRHTLKEDQHIPALLADARKMAEGAGSALLKFLIAYSEAWFALDEGNGAACRASLSRAFALAREHGYVNFTWCIPTVLVRLCVEALKAEVETPFVQRLIRSRGLRCSAPPVQLEHWPWSIRVYTLGRFGVVKDDTPLRFSGKAQRRPLQMLKVLIALGGREVPESRLSEILWPDAEGDKAHSAFTTTLARLRKLVGEESLCFRDGRLSVDAHRCWVDAWVLQRLLGEAETAPSSESARALMHKALDLYRGAFLGSEEDTPWVRGARERVRRRLVQTVKVGARYFGSGPARTQTAAMLSQFVAVDPSLEDII